MMPDIEKVMSGLEGLTWDDWSEYHSNSEVQNIAKDTLELLKEQNKELDHLKKCRHDCKIDCLLDKYENVLKENEKLKEELEASNGTITNLLDQIEEIGSWLPVHCKDCKHWKEKVKSTTKWLPCIEMETDKDWFCADGERK